MTLNEASFWKSCSQLSSMQSCLIILVTVLFPFQQLEDKADEVTSLTDETRRLQQLCDARAETNRLLNQDLTTQYNKVSAYD